MIVDCHTHLFASGRGGPLDLPASADDLVREMDQHGVARAVVLPLPDTGGNLFVHEQCARHRDRLTPLYLPEFEQRGCVIRNMERFFHDWPAHGLKIHPRRQGISINEPEVRDTLAWAAERGLTVLFDVFLWGASLGNADLEPLAYHALAQALPNLRMVLAHAGGHKIMDAFLVAKANPNVFLDVSFTPVYFRGSSIAQDVGFVCARLPAGRVLYGSDFPFTYFGQHLEIVQDLARDVTPAVQRALFGEAARALFRIT